MKFLPSLCSLMFLAGVSANAQVVFNFDYSDPSASYWSAESRAALDTAATRMASYFTGYTANVTLRVTGSNENTGRLASAGSNYTAPSGPGFTSLGVIGTKIISQGATDLNGSAADGVVDANFFHAWSFTDTVGSSQYDFTNVMMHELGHAMGFLSLIAQGGGSVFGNNTTAGGYYSPFDQYLVNGSGVDMVDHGTLTTGSAWLDASTGGTGTVPATPDSGLYFNGTNALAANGGNLVPIYSPASWEQGSSAAHLDTNYYTGADQKLMNHAVTTGPGVRGLSELELAMFRDLGYDLVQIPEPGTVLLLFSGSVFLLRRRRGGW